MTETTPTLTLLPVAIVTDRDGMMVGRIVGLYPEPVTGVAAWAATTLADPEHVVLVPLTEAVWVPGGIQVPYRGTQLQAAPAAPAAPILSESDLSSAVAHYYPGADDPRAGTLISAPRHAAHGRTSDSEVVLTRSEEQLHLGTETIPFQRLRLRRCVVTEEHTVTVALRREEFRLEREPITDGTPGSGGELAGEGDDVIMVLHAERPVITTEIVPTERIRVSTCVVTGEQVVEDSVRREVIDTLPINNIQDRPRAPNRTGERRRVR